MAVILRNMTGEEFDIFCQWSIAHHARELTEELHLPAEEAANEARKELSEMLPDGLNTEHHRLMTVAEAACGETAGFIWTLHEETAGRKQSFVCDFAIWEPKRRSGYGTAALRLAEMDAMKAGCQESVLFVSDRNKAAIALYRKCGYQVLRQADYGKYMIKQLSLTEEL